jgi:hypothetical protein
MFKRTTLAELEEVKQYGQCSGVIARQTMYTSRNSEACSRNHCCHGNAISVTYSECVCLYPFKQEKKLMRPIVLSSAARLAAEKIFHIVS